MCPGFFSRGALAFACVILHGLFGGGHVLAEAQCAVARLGRGQHVLVPLELVRGAHRNLAQDEQAVRVGPCGVHVVGGLGRRVGKVEAFA